MLSYASDFTVIDQDMHLKELQAEGRDRVMEMTGQEGYVPAAETNWALVELWDGLHLLGVTPVEPAIKPKRQVASAG